MSEVMKREDESPVRPDLFDRFDRIFGDWMTSLPIRRFWEHQDEGRDQLIRVEQFEEEGHEVVRAEIPGVDPQKDIDITVSGGSLRISAERKQEEKKEERGYVRNELRYGKFIRILPVPEGTTEQDVKATYKDGILEVRFPIATAKPATKVPIEKK
jgi:HSP20 family protein